MYDSPTVRVLLPNPPPAPFDEILEARRRMGLDRRDKVWGLLR